MFNTPSRAPRRTLGRAPGSRASMFSGEIASSTSRTPAFRSRTSSMRPTSPVSEAGESVRTVRRASGQHERDEWERDRVCWSRDERHAVIATGALPSEVAELVRGADFIVNSVAAQIDTASGFVLVSTPSSCVAWNYAKRTHSSPTVYVFPAPQPTRSHLAAVPPALAAFCSPGPEPGLLLVSATGELRFWESMSLALANVQRFQTVQLHLGDDFAERLWKIDPTTFVLTTTASTAWRITIAPVGGRIVPHAVPFTRSGGLFNRASPTIFTDSAERNGVVAVAPTAGGAYLLGRSTLQKWTMGPDGSVRLVQEFSLRESIGSSMFEENRAWQSGNVHLELNDLVAVGPDQLAALVSYSQHHGSSAPHRGHRYAIVPFENNAYSNTIMMGDAVHISYLAHPDPRMLDVPRLHIPLGGKTAFVRFADAIVMASLSNTPYEDTVTLKDSAYNAFIGVAPIPVTIPGSSSLVAMAASGGMMTIEVNESATQTRQLSSQASATARIKSKIEQAVFFGDRSDNPLSLDLPVGFEGDLAQAAEEVSAQIVSSSSPYMPAIFETRPQLTDRLARLRELMTFIHRNGVLSLLPMDSRRRLSSHAEKVKAAIDLWDYQNRLMDKLHTRTPQSLLADSIEMLMNEVGGASGAEDDVVRLFFRKEVMNLDRLLDTVFATFRAAANAAGPNADLSDWVLEANRIFVTVLRSATQFRAHEKDVYNVDTEYPSIELWTAADPIINDLDALYADTQQLIKDRTRKFGSVVDEAPPAGTVATTDLVQQQKDQAQLKLQMTRLAAELCENMDDKLRTSSTQVNGGADPSEGLSLAQRWEELKPRIIRPLVDIERVDDAYELAEHYHDFPTLVYLCHNPLSSAGPERIEQYIERFGEQFAFVLYQWYIDQGQLHALLTQDEVYGSLLTAFFAKYPHPELSWIHDLACKRYGVAATALVAVEADTESLAQKHLVASIGKLAAVAQVQTRGDAADTRLLSGIDDELERIDVQSALKEYITSVAPSSGHPRRPSASGYVAAQKTLEPLPAFKSLLERLVKRVLAGNALDTEGIVDALTLRDHGDRDGRDNQAATALECIARDSALPTGRKEVALLSVWRRVYVADDWANIANTSGRSEEAQRGLQRETLTYATLRALESMDLPPNFTLTPRMASTPPTSAELAARFPTLPSSDIDALMADHAREIASLTGLVDAGLDEQVRAVRELVVADKGDGDVDM